MTNKNDDNICKITIYDNERIKVQNNYFNPFSNTKNNYVNTKIVQPQWPYISRKQYVRTLRKYRKLCYEFKLNALNCVFITLTTKKLTDWNEINVKTNSFIKCLKRNFGKLYYIRAIESHDKNTHYHIHLLIMFNNAKPKQINKQWVSSHWKYGLTDYQDVIEPYGIIEYLTLFKPQNLLPSNKYYTKFPQFIKIITHSQDFPMSRKTEILAKEQDKHKIINQINNECFEETGQNLHYFSDGHVYYNLYGPKYCIDKEFFHRPI